MALSSPYFWTLLGFTFCVMEVFIPSAFTESALGLAAFSVAIVALFFPQFWFQSLIWVALSTLMILWFRRLARDRRTEAWPMDDTAAKTLTSIPAGEVGRVIYEGASWQARCQDSTLEIAANHTVTVVRQQGNTLFVLPEKQ